MAAMVPLFIPQNPNPVAKYIPFWDVAPIIGKPSSVATFVLAHRPARIDDAVDIKVFKNRIKGGNQQAPPIFLLHYTEALLTRSEPRWEHYLTEERCKKRTVAIT